MPTILVVDDEPSIIDLATLYLEGEGFSVRRAATGREALEQVAAATPDLVILDIMLPEMSGWEVCKALRAQHAQLPVIMVTARGDAVDRVVGLELGADDYVVKPFHGRELVARVRAVLRRADWDHAAGNGAHGPQPLLLGDVVIDPAGRTVKVLGREIPFRAREFELLWHLARHQGIAFSREQLLEQVWGYDFLGESRTVDVHVAHVRKHLIDSRSVSIETIWSVGYKLVVNSALPQPKRTLPSETDHRG
jgi:DNA-binding response OmpR family regulator